MCMDINYCRRCGEKLTQSGDSYSCANGHTLYLNPIPGVALFLVNPERTHIKLAVRAYEPDAGKLNAIGGFMDIGETAEEALYRELFEEVGLSPDDISTPQFISTETSLYHYGGESRPMLCIAYWATVQPDVTLHPADDVAEVHDYPIDSLPFDELHSEDDVTALKKLHELLAT